MGIYKFCLRASRPKAVERGIFSSQASFLDSKAIEPGTNPILTDDGIFMIYNGWTDVTSYKPFAGLFSRENPSKVLERGDETVLTPIKNWGKVFGCDDHIVAEGLVEHKGYWWLYYGAADRAICLAKYKVRR